MERISFPKQWDSNLHYEQLPAVSIAPHTVKGLPPFVDAEAVVAVANCWMDICREIAEHVYADAMGQAIPLPVPSPYMTAVSIMIVGLHAGLDAEQTIKKLQVLRGQCKKAMVSTEAR